MAVGLRTFQLDADGYMIKYSVHVRAFQSFYLDEMLALRDDPLLPEETHRTGVDDLPTLVLQVNGTLERVGRHIDQEPVGAQGIDDPVYYTSWVRDGDILDVGLCIVYGSMGGRGDLGLKEK